jgi:hypothetical protein
MKALIILVFCLFNLGSIGNCQPTSSKFYCLQGIWKKTFLDEKDDSTYISFTIYKSNKKISFFHKKDTLSNEFTLIESSIEFQNLSRYQLDSLDTLSLKNNGNYYTAYISSLNNIRYIKKPYFGIAMYFNCNKNYLEIDETSYERRIEIPYNTLKLFKLNDKINNRDNIYKYLNIRTGIINKKIPVYLNNKKNIVNFLHKGEIIIIKRQKGEWLEVEYRNKTTINGWIKRKY